MGVPGFQSLMLPVLYACADGEVDSKQIRALIAKKLSFTDDDLEEMLPSGSTTVFKNRVAWALTYLQTAGLLDRVRRGVYIISDEGRLLLRNPPDRIDLKYLENYPKYVQWRHAKSSKKQKMNTVSVDATNYVEATPEEIIDNSYQSLLSSLQLDLLERLRDIHFAEFESIIIDLLIAMGYGGGRSEMGEAIGRSGDGGIDGLIREDPLGLDIVYVQAKRYAQANSVGRPEVQSFAGSLDGVSATKGLFFTTSTFTAGAKEFAQRISKRIVLIDGDELSRLMVQHNVGVRLDRSYVIKRVDEDYFSG